MNKRVAKKKTKLQKEARNWKDFLSFIEDHINKPITKDELLLFVSDKVMEEGD